MKKSWYNILLFMLLVAIGIYAETTIEETTITEVQRINATIDVCIQGGNCLSTITSSLWSLVDVGIAYTNSSGRVGIGTNSPLYVLDVVGATNPRIRVQDSVADANDNAEVNFQTPTGAWSQYLQSPTNELRLYSDSDLFKFTTTGDLNASRDVCLENGLCLSTINSTASEIVWTNNTDTTFVKGGFPEQVNLTFFQTTNGSLLFNASGMPAAEVQIGAAGTGSNTWLPFNAGTTKVLYAGNVISIPGVWVIPGIGTYGMGVEDLTVFLAVDTSELYALVYAPFGYIRHTTRNNRYEDELQVTYANLNETAGLWMPNLNITFNAWHDNEECLDLNHTHNGTACGGAVIPHTESAPSRALNTVYQNTKLTPIQVYGSVSIQTSLSGDVGKAIVLTGASSPPTTVKQETGYHSSALVGAVNRTEVFFFVVQSNEFYSLNSSTAGGASVDLGFWQEVDF